nr:MAG TPA: hypothetical protein [Caudoviricetes sp.]
MEFHKMCSHLLDYLLTIFSKNLGCRCIVSTHL